jgi:hypothetical protein
MTALNQPIIRKKPSAHGKMKTPTRELVSRSRQGYGTSGIPSLPDTNMF